MPAEGEEGEKEEKVEEEVEEGEKVSVDEGLVTQSVGAAVVSNVPVGRAPISGGNATDHPTNF